jgi:hypothetical protein
MILKSGIEIKMQATIQNIEKRYENSISFFTSHFIDIILLCYGKYLSGKNH